jgi:hypothetical protein
VPPIKLDEARVDADSPAPPDARRLVYRRDARLPNKLVDEPVGPDIVKHKPVVTRQGDPKAPQAGGIVRPYSIRGHLRRDPQR